ncbi:MAG: type III-A CRISPR-associated RAMP protein Csm3 [Thermodesulfobacteriota bacterium]
MSDLGYRKLIGKIEIRGELECLTGLHIGASKENMEIGALDSPVVRDPLTNEPYVPGSSLKGKLRSFLEKATPELLPKRNGGTARNPIMRHECEDWEPRGGNVGALHCPVCRLFGSTGPGEGNRNYPARLKVRDLHLTNVKDLAEMDTGLLYTEWKFENSIDRVTSAANPRNLERVPRGAKFDISIVYDVEDPDTLEEDLKNLRLAVELLHDDALGGHGSRGYGRVKLGITQITARKIDYYRGEEGRSKSVSGIGEVNTLVEYFKN